MPRLSDPNRCRANEVVPLAVTRPRRCPVVASPPPRHVRPAHPPRDGEDACSNLTSDTRLFSYEVRLDIAQRYHAWILVNRKRAESPIDDLVADYGCNRDYPKRIFDKMMATGSLHNRWAGGRPKVFSPNCFRQMGKVIRKGRKNQRRVSSRETSAQLKKKRAKQNKPAPGKDTICKAKKRLGWKLHKVKAKPKLSNKLLGQRLQMAKERLMSTDKYYISKNARTVFADEKWFSEEKGTLLQFEAREESPVPASIRFRGKDAETHTQRVKIMFMLCVTSTTPIGVYELDFKKWNKENDAKTLAGQEAKGITAAYLKTILKKVGRDAREKLGPGKISFLHDKARPYLPLLKDEELSNLFEGGVQLAAGKAPDMSHLDTGVCPFMEREVEKEGALTPKEIRKVVKKAFKKITPDMCKKISKKVRKNMHEVIQRKGGNFYKE